MELTWAMIMEYNGKQSQRIQASGAGSFGARIVRVAGEEYPHTPRLFVCVKDCAGLGEEYPHTPRLFVPRHDGEEYPHTPRHHAAAPAQFMTYGSL